MIKYGKRRKIKLQKQKIMHLINTFLSFLVAVGSILFTGCGEIPESQNTLTDSIVCDTNKYAKGFSIERRKTYTILKVTNPWQGAKKVSYSYYLLSKDKPIPAALYDKQIIKTPIKRIICLSTTHIGFIDCIDELNTIVGISGKKYVNNAKLQTKIKNNEIADVGYDQNLNYELIVSLQPDIVMAYGVESQNIRYILKLKELEIPTIINAEYLEASPLGKTEWIKFVAALYEKEKMAQKKFNTIATEYNKLKEKIKETITEHPQVVCNVPYNGTWYVPGGKSYAAKLIADAGGNYLWRDNQSHESIPLNIESVFQKARNADIWINTGMASTTDDILKTDPRLAEMKAYQNKQLYNNNARCNAHGGNDYWESGITKPHLILNDLAVIFYPGLASDYKFYYYQKLQ